MAAASRGERALVVFGLALLGGYVAMATRVEVAWLTALQDDDRYAVASGLVLAIYLLLQWTLGARRAIDPLRAVTRHKIAGALAPLLLYAHASRFAYGYLAVLAIAYLGTVGLGLVHRLVLRVRTRWLYTLWFVVHVATSAALLVLVAYHVVIALGYE